MEPSEPMDVHTKESSAEEKKVKQISYYKEGASDYVKGEHG